MTIEPRYPNFYNSDDLCPISLERFNIHLSHSYRERPFSEHLDLVSKVVEKKSKESLMIQALNLTESPDILVKQPCRHMFRKAMIVRWTEKKDTCPLCRVNFNPLLFIAAKSGDEAKVKSLLAEGVDVNRQNSKDVTALYISAQNGHSAIADRLLDQGASVNREHRDGMTPLYIATQNNHESMVTKLLHHRADVNRADPRGDTPLHIAAFNRHGFIAESLLRQGAFVDQTNNLGMTPLHAAALFEVDGTAVTESLLFHRADINKVTQFGMTPLQAAEFKGNVGAIEKLLSHEGEPGV
ncbi:MAG: hypothetical protein ACI9S8_002222 [Chlamydiales bacterium]|jgi:hypothetical protein